MPEPPVPQSARESAGEKLFCLTRINVLVSGADTSHELYLSLGFNFFSLISYARIGECLCLLLGTAHIIPILYVHGRADTCNL